MHLAFFVLCTKHGHWSGVFNLLKFDHTLKKKKRKGAIARADPNPNWKPTPTQRYPLFILFIIDVAQVPSSFRFDSSICVSWWMFECDVLDSGYVRYS